MTDREQLLFDALCAVRHSTAEASSDNPIAAEAFEIATKAVRAVHRIPAQRAPDETAREVVTKWINDCGGGLILTFVQSELLQERIREVLPPPALTSTERKTGGQSMEEAAADNFGLTVDDLDEDEE